MGNSNFILNEKLLEDFKTENDKKDFSGCYVDSGK